MTIINCTPHEIVITGGPSIPASGQVARVNANLTPIGEVVTAPCTGGIDEHEHRVFCGCPEEGTGWTAPIFHQEFGEITGLPAPAPGVKFVVSAVVLAAAKAWSRGDCLAPATGHPDVIRNEKGQIVSVPGFVC